MGVERKEGVVVVVVVDVAVECFIYIYIYIVVGQVIRTPTVKPQREFDFFFKSIYYLPGKSVGARTRCCSPPVCHLLSGALFSNESAPAFHMRLQKPLKFDHRFFDFSKSHWRPHSSYVFDMTSSCYNTCDHPGLSKL